MDVEDEQLEDIDGDEQDATIVTSTPATCKTKKKKKKKKKAHVDERSFNTVHPIKLTTVIIPLVALLESICI